MWLQSNISSGNSIYNSLTFDTPPLNFVKSQKVEYKQFDNDFVPWLSIIDILMFNDKKAVKEQFTAHNIV